VKRSGAGRAAAPPTTDGGTNTPDETGVSRSFPIVGIGASAGGLEAFSALLKSLPVDTGMGFVLVQHLDPEHDSVLTQLLGRATLLPVREVTQNLRVEPNHVYVIPPNTNLSIASGVLTLSPRPLTHTPHRSIDFFLEALALDQHERAIGVILSGTATDGTIGLEAIKAEGGITFAQDDSARYDSMPRSAVAAGCVDFILSPEGIANELARIAKHPAVAAPASGFLTPAEESRASATTHEDEDAPSAGRGTPRTGRKRAKADRDSMKEIGARAEEGFKKILLLLRNHSGVDLSLYKFSTIQRRITRRIVLTKHDTLESYTQFLRGNTKELDALYTDVLISVTSFFRNPDAFEVLRRKVWPTLLHQRGDEPIRVWTLGCSTGQEAYSIAMTFVEANEKASRIRKLQVFATDLNDTLLEKARHGLYAKSVAGDLSPERLRRFFVEEEGGYRVSKALREMVIFARQNVMSDPPFSRMDIISCRNLLIYFEPALQKKVFPTFHYALKPGGFLYLGASESIGGFTELFEPVDKKHKIYAKKAAPTPAFHLPTRKHRGGPPEHSQTLRAPQPLQADQERTAGVVPGELNAQREADRVVVSQFAPPAVLINADLQILQFRGPTGAYLEPPTGKASFDLLKMARNGLMLPLRSAVNKAKKDKKTARQEHVRIEQGGKARTITLEVIPLKNLHERCFLVVFEDEETVGRSAGTSRGKQRRVEGHAERSPRAAESRRIAALEAELAEMRDYLQSIQEQHEAANEELQASNEEVQSANEELQSINEEMETSKEELESANEELTTVNEEMAHRNTELNRLNNDLLNLQTSAHQAIVLLGRDLTIRRFSVQAEKQFNLLAVDVGRPIGNVRHNLDMPDLESFITEVIDGVRAREREVQDKDGRWFSLRVRPYLTLDNTVDGAVLVLVDINDLKRSELAIASAREYAENIIGTMREPLVVLDPELRIESVNRAFYRTFGVTPADTIGKFIDELGNRQWDIPELRALLEELLPRDHAIEDFVVERDFGHLGRRIMLLNARRMHNPAGIQGRIVLAIEDITERKQTEDQLRDSEHRFTQFMEHLPGLAWIKDADGRYVYANDAALKAFRTPRAELYGKSDQEVFPQETAAQFAANDRLALDRESSIQTIEALRQDDGIVHQSFVNKFSIPGSDGDAVLVGGVAIDITELKEAEAAVRASEARYRSLFASTDEGFCVIEKVEGEPDAPLDFRYVEANPAFATQSGVSGVVGKTIREVFPGEPEAWFHTYDAILRTGEPIRFERGLVSQGRVLELYAFRIEDDSQRRVAVIFKDITARKQAAEAQARLAAIVASSDDAIVSKDLNGVITSWNGGAERLFGYTAEEAVGQPITLLIPPERFDEEGVILERIRRADVVEHFETVRRRKDGTLFHASVTVSPIRDSHGMVVGASKIARDITERKWAENALRDSEERYRTLFDLGPVAVYSCDAAGVIQKFNRRAVELWGRAPGPGDTDLRFCGSFKLFRPDGRFLPHEEWPMAEVVAGRIPEARDEEVVIERPDGSRVTVVVNILPLKDQRGEVTGAINCFYDITERKRVEETMRESDRHKTEFLAMLAHELRNPLAPILVSIEILRQAKSALHPQRHQKTDESSAMADEPNPRIDHALEVLQRQVGQMVRLVDDLLDAGRISRGKIDLRMERVELSSVVYHVVDAVRPISDARDQQLTVTLPSEPVYLDADPTRLAQIVGNILNNACKFTDRSGRIWLTAERGDQSAADGSEVASTRVGPHVVIRVRDTGIGIAADQLEHVFDMFTQADTALERSLTGLGIGLTLVKTLTEMHGGTVEASSDGVGRGSEFVVRLPIAVETEMAPSPPMVTASAAVTPLRILIVDDNRDSADMLAMLLKLTGHETFTAHDGLAAVDAATLVDPDVILLDIGLPGLNGYEVARRIREQQRETRRPLLVALTGWGQDEDRRRSEEAGFDAHMVKPVDESVLRRVLTEVGAAKQEVRD
jgi:two-component system, chemotaxis family, CheB/CheR fusion protein